MSDLPVELVLALPAQFDQPVTTEFIDLNGHMNIGDYFRFGTWGPWTRLIELGVDDDYVPVRQMSMFTAEHHIRYLAELRLGQRFSVHTVLVERTAKALRGAGVIVDRDHDRVACVIEIVWVHVSMTDRRPSVFPDDIAAALDADLTRGADLAPYVDRLTCAGDARPGWEDRPMSSTSNPSYDDIAGLPAYLAQPIPAAFEDINGHLNIRHYVGIASEGLDESLVEVGIPQTWPITSGQGVFSAEHHMTYLHELRTGDRCSVRVRLLARSERAAHVLVYLLDDTHHRVSYVMEEVFLHVSMDDRRTSPWPAEVAALLDARIAEHDALGWPPGTSGSMKLR